MKLFGRTTQNDKGYVALEFCVAMGLLVIPTMMLVLQIPSFLEKRDRLVGIVSTVAGNCANDANTIDDGVRIARDSTARELSYNSSFKNSVIISARCEYEIGAVESNSKVTAYIEVEVPSALLPGVPGFNGKTTWTYHAQHSVIIPPYRSFEE